LEDWQIAAVCPLNHFEGECGMKLSIAIQTPEVLPIVPVALLSGTFEEKLSKAAAWGADGVELMTTQPNSLDPIWVCSLLAKYRLAASAVASGAIAFAEGLTLLHADAEVAARAKSRLYDLIDLAAELEAPVVTIGSFRGRLANIKEGSDGRKILAEILSEAAAYAHPHAVRLALEPINRFETDFLANAEQALAFVDQVDQPALGLLLDTFHVNIEETSWTEPFKRVMKAGKLWHVHLGDNNRWPPGRGLIDFPAILAALKEVGYQGYLSAELLQKPDADTAAQQTLAYMRSLLAALR
jgi:sugar phosphate isomerase/epimerase